MPRTKSKNRKTRIAVVESDFSDKSPKYQEVWKRFVAAVDFLVEERNVSKVEISQGIGASNTTLDRYLCGETRLPLNSILLFSQKYNICLDWLIHGIKKDRVYLTKNEAQRIINALNARLESD